jgi:hypothetical protein
MRVRLVATVMAATAAAWAAPAEAVEVTLRGSPESMERQHAVARQQDLPFARTRAEMERLTAEGRLVPVEGPHYGVAEWVNPVAIPEVRLFVERLAHQYLEACGDTLVVTSLTRPMDEQPPNAHSLSVHPAGMAVDFRIPQNQECRRWIEAAFLNMERMGLIDATLERRPPHYHVAVFPEPYARFAAARQAEEARAGEAARAAAAAARGEGAAAPAEAEPGGAGLYVLLAVAVLSLVTLGLRSALSRP